MNGKDLIEWPFMSVSMTPYNDNYIIFLASKLDIPDKWFLAEE